MAAFPTLKHTTDSTHAVEGGQAVDYAEDGVARVRSLYAAARHRFDLELICTTAERTALLAHYASEGVAAFSYSSPEDSVAYSVRYVAYPLSAAIRATGLWRMRVALEGAAA
jgi:hypothetical protein